ncbi:heavy metal-associated domain-containing protein [beta proteobacterium MWH-UniP1]
MTPTQSTFHIDGMTCGGCEKSVSRTILSFDTVADVSVDRSQHQAVVSWKAGLSDQAMQAASQQICQAVEAAGFDCRPI